MAQIEFWYEFASTYSYPAAWRIDRLAAAQGVKVVWRPLVLGPLFHKQQGMSDSPFNVVEVKGRYMWRDMERVCHGEMLPFRKPSVFPRRTLAGCPPRAGGRQTRLDRQLQPRGLRRQLRSGPGYRRPGGAVADWWRRWAAIRCPISHEANSDEIKGQLRANVEEAEAKGLFGAPSFVIPSANGGYELFWGNDRLEQAVAWAAER